MSPLNEDQAKEYWRRNVALMVKLMVIWFVAIVITLPRALTPLEWALGVDLRLDLLGSGAVPASYIVSPLVLIGATAMAITWLLANARRGRGVAA